VELVPRNTAHFLLRFRSGFFHSRHIAQFNTGGKMSEPTDSFDDVWDLVSFSIREGLALRSFLEYLQTWPDQVDKKLQRIQNWRAEVGLIMGSPRIGEQALTILQKLRAVPPSIRKEVIEKSLELSQAQYLGHLK
jgi:hypothetical protein